MTGSGNNTYLLVGREGDGALIDAGVGDAGHLEQIAAELSGRRARLADVLVTHAHSDHASGAITLQRAYPLARFHKFPWEHEDQKYPVAWQPLQDGSRVLKDDCSLVAVHTPGHSPDHVAFWHEPSGAVFTGDLVIRGASVMIHTSGGGDLRAYLASLERIRALKPRRLLPAHGPEVTEPDDLLRQYIDHRLLREQQVVEALSTEPRTVESIAESIYHGLDPALVWAARENVRAHLHKLKHEGLAHEEESSHTWTR
jgi:glyoxylase-like metal-dependent hydrolase (beta-lactamase superfamily II)